MKVATIRLSREPYKSFIVHTEKDPFTPWHHHPEYELVLIKRGKGRRLVGDHVARFEKDDLIFLGPFLPHQWICDNSNDNSANGFQNEAFVIQFSDDFLGNEFFEISETSGLKKILIESSRGIEFFGNTKTKIISVLHKMFSMNDSKRFYALLSIFELIESTSEIKYLATPNSINNFSSKNNEPMQLALKYIYQNFQQNIQIKDMLEITHKSYPSFYSTFKKTFMMSFKDYLINVRVGYACKLLAEGSMQISEIAHDVGFENLSNFNCQFKKIKNITPREFQKQYEEGLINI